MFQNKASSAQIVLMLTCLSTLAWYSSQHLVAAAVIWTTLPPKTGLNDQRVLDLQAAFFSTTPEQKVDFLLSTSSIIPATATALEFGLFDMLKEPKTFDQVIHLLNISERATEVLLQTLVGANFVLQNEQDGMFRSQLPTIGSDAIAFVMTWKFVMQRQFYYFTESAIKDEPIGLRKTIAPEVHDLYQARAQGLPDVAKWWDEMMDNVNIHLERDTSLLSPLVGSNANVLDVCGNEGANAIRIAKANPKFHVAMTDLPGQVTRANSNIIDAGLQGRVSAFPFDALSSSIDFGMASYDAVYMFHAVSIFDYTQLASIFGAIFRALRPGGVFMFDTVTGLARGQMRANYLNLLPAYFLTSATSTHRIKLMPVLLESLRNVGFKTFRVAAEGHFLEPSQAVFEKYDSFLDRQLYVIAQK